MRTITFNLSDEDYEAVKDCAKLEGTSMSAWLRGFIGELARGTADDIRAEQRGEITQYFANELHGLFGEGI